MSPVGSMNARAVSVSNVSHVRAPVRPLARRQPLARPQARRHRTMRVNAELMTGAISSTDLWVYGGLGSAALSFLATFFVAPRFKESFKEDLDWKDIFPELVKLDVKTVTPEEAFAKQRKGLASKALEFRAANSVNVPLYLPIQQWDLASNIRRLGFAFFGMYGTELNVNFGTEAGSNIPKGREVVVMCETGGSLENKSGTQFGFQSRSLKALYFLKKAGFSKVYHMQGGFGQWVRDDLPVEEGAPGAAQGDDESQPTVVLSVLERLLSK